MKDESFSDKSIWGKLCNLESNKFYFISSDSGKGKSTLLSFIYGLRTDYDGKITIDNQNQKDISIDNWSSLRTDRLSFLISWSTTKNCID